jgi:hypothetical protein
MTASAGPSLTGLSAAALCFLAIAASAQQLSLHLDFDQEFQPGVAGPQARGAVRSTERDAETRSFMPMNEFDS